MSNLENHYTVKFARLLLDYEKQGKITGILNIDKILLNHVMRNKIKEYDVVKLIDQTLCKYEDLFKQAGIKYKTLEEINSVKVGGKPAFNKISVYIDLQSNMLEIRLPWLTKEKFEPLIKFFREEMDMEFEKRMDSDPVWFTIIRDEKIFDDLKNNKTVKELGYEIDENQIKKSKEKLKVDKESQKQLFKLSTTAVLGTETEQFKGVFEKLYPFQKVAVEYSKFRNGILIADEMGLGKTLEALAIIEYHQLYPAVIVVPTMLRKNWAREITKWLPHKKVSIIESQKIIPPGDIYVVSYRMISSLGSRFYIKKPKVLVCDESHYLKNPDSARTDYVLKYFKDVDFKILTTGTPILNRTLELVPQLELIGVLDTHFGGRRKFIKRYAPPQWNGYGTVYGSANEEELQVELRKSCMLRRMKKDVMSEMPDKIRQVIPLPLSDREAYEKVEKDSINWYETKLRRQDLSETEVAEMVTEKLLTRSAYAEKMVKVEYLRQAAVTYKMDAVFEWIDDALEQVNKLVVFAHHRDIVEMLHNRYKDKSVMLYGGMSGKIDEIVDKFVTDPKTHLFIGSLQSSGIGIDGLQRVCDRVAFVEMPWTPAQVAQAEDRLHRIGQNNTVNIYYLLAENSIEEYVFSVVVEKEEIFEKATNINKLFSWIKKKGK